MKLTAIRISHEGWSEVDAHAKQRGISAAEWIREAIFMRLGQQQFEREYTKELRELRLQHAQLARDLLERVEGQIPVGRREYE